MHFCFIFLYKELKIVFFFSCLSIRMDFQKIISIFLKAMLALLAIQQQLASVSGGYNKKHKKIKFFEALGANNYSEKRFNEWTWLTAHNSHLNWHDSSVLYMARNQELSIDDQLRYGVRGFMFDIDIKTCSSLSILLGTCSCEGTYIKLQQSKLNLKP